jgi:16S rRNA (uracil1498-N3)-methyltransferase
VVERDDRAAVASFVTAKPFVAGERLALDDGAAQHVRVRRLDVGSRVRLLDGAGLVGWGRLAEVGKRSVIVEVARVAGAPKPAPLEVIVPIADRDRMLLAAEKCVELQITGWRPAYFARSRSVSPRGEGEGFHEKVRARMRSALEQSGGSWLPEIHRAVEWAGAMDGIPVAWTRVLLDVGGVPLSTLAGGSPLAIAVGPEGGLEAQEKSAAEQRGWRIASIGGSTLRFETALIAGVAIVRALQPTARS